MVSKMARVISMNAQLLEDNEGSFINEHGEKVHYHNAKFYDLDEYQTFKANIPDGQPVPPVAQPGRFDFSLVLGEKFTKLEYVGPSASK